MSSKHRFKIPVAVFMIVRNDDQILLLQRSNTGWKDGQWSLPAGGLEEGENLIEGVIRETKEEIGIDISAEDIQHKYTQHCLIREQNWINVYFETYIWKGSPVLCEPQKHSDLQWTTREQLPENMVSYVREALSENELPVIFKE